MTKTYKRYLLAALLTAVPLFAACERVDEISNITAVDAPQLNAGGAPRGLVRLVERVSSTSSAQNVDVQWVFPNFDGTLKVGEYVLLVPAGAVKTPTLFRMEVMTGSYIGVRLHAKDVSGRAVTRFRTPLRLTMPYSEANTEEIDPTKLVIANIAEDGSARILEVLEASANPSELLVSGLIYHFSDYAVGQL